MDTFYLALDFISRTREESTTLEGTKIKIKTTDCKTLFMCSATMNSKQLNRVDGVFMKIATVD